MPVFALSENDTRGYYHRWLEERGTALNMVCLIKQDIKLNLFEILNMFSKSFREVISCDSLLLTRLSLFNASYVSKLYL